MSRLWAETRHAATLVGYWVRPYDTKLDARRWRWQPAGCVLDAEFARANHDALQAAVAAHLARTEGTTDAPPAPHDPR